MEKQAFSQAALISFAASFAKERDYEVDPIAFVSSFVDSGIIRFDSDRAVFSLPFVESYLLAVELSEDAEAAIRYFDLNRTDFDVGTFDLYAELGATNEVVRRVNAALQTSIDNFQLLADEEHVLLSDNVRPSSLASLDRLDTLRKRLSDTADDVRAGKGDTGRKQRLLDIADQIRETAVDKAGFGREMPERSDEEKNVDYATQSWAIAATLLGAGAEELDAETKQVLACNIVRLSSIIIHRWTLSNATVDFAEIKAELTTEKALQEATEGKVDKDDLGEIKRSVEGIVDYLEFAFLAEPFRRITGHLCEAARLKVLAASIDKVQVVDPFEQLMLGVWMSDIDASRGKDRLKRSIKNLADVPFLRAVMATHFIMRVYWEHWNKEDRLQLLDAASNVLKPVARIDSGRLRRMVERDDSESKIKSSQ